MFFFSISLLFFFVFVWFGFWVVASRRCKTTWIHFRMRRSRKSNIYFQNCRHLAFRWQFRSFIFGKTSRVFCFASSCCVAVLFSSPQERSGPFHLIQNWRATGPLELKHAQLADPSWIWRNRAGRLKKKQTNKKNKKQKKICWPMHSWMCVVSSKCLKSDSGANQIARLHVEFNWKNSLLPSYGSVIYSFLF